MDILELLENLTVEPHQQAIIDAAVDEIERLRGQIVFERLSLRSALDKLRKLDGDIERLRKDKAELLEEIKKLKEAKEINNYNSYPDDGFGGYPSVYNRR